MKMNEDFYAHADTLVPSSDQPFKVLFKYEYTKSESMNTHTFHFKNWLVLA